MLAGLISQQNNTIRRRTGWSDMPVVGPLFSGKRSQQDETELLILVTPEIVRPMDAEEVPPVPGHEVTAPNDCEFFKCGKTEGCPDPNVYQSAALRHRSKRGRARRLPTVQFTFVHADGSRPGHADARGAHRTAGSGSQHAVSPLPADADANSTGAGQRHAAIAGQRADGQLRHVDRWPDRADRCDVLGLGLAAN